MDWNAEFESWSAPTPVPQVQCNVSFSARIAHAGKGSRAILAPTFFFFLSFWFYTSIWNGKCYCMVFGMSCKETRMFQGLLFPLSRRHQKYCSVSTEAQAFLRIFSYFRNTQKTQACFYIYKIQIPSSGFITSWY